MCRSHALKPPLKVTAESGLRWFGNLPFLKRLWQQRLIATMADGDRRLGAVASRRPENFDRPLEIDARPWHCAANPECIACKRQHGPCRAGIETVATEGAGLRAVITPAQRIGKQEDQRRRRSCPDLVRLDEQTQKTFPIRERCSMHRRNARADNCFPMVPQCAASRMVRRSASDIASPVKARGDHRSRNIGWMEYSELRSLLLVIGKPVQGRRPEEEASGKGMCLAAG